MGFKTSGVAVNLASDNQRQVNKDIYSPYYNKKNPPAGGEYVAYLRFVPNMLNQQAPVVSKAILSLGDPLQPEGGSRKEYYDSPETIGDRNNVATQLFWDLMNTKEQTKKDLAKNCCSTYNSFYAFVQVVSDPNIPDFKPYEVKLWRFGKDVYDMIVEENKDEGNPFDLLTGRVFKLVIYQEYGQNKYKKSKFVSNEKAHEKGFGNQYCYLGGDGNYYAVNDQLDDEMCDAIEANLTQIQQAMDTDVMTYHPWTAEEEKHISERCQLIREVAYPDMYARTGTVGGAAPISPMAQPSVPTVSAQPMVAQPVSAPRPTPVPAAAPIAAAPVVTSPAAAPVAAPIAAAPVVATPAAAPTMPAASAPVAPTTPSAGFNDAGLNALLEDDGAPF